MGFDPERIAWAIGGGRRLRVQAPGAADRQARPADVGRRLPLPAAPAGLGPDLARQAWPEWAPAAAPRRRAAARSPVRVACTSSRRRSAISPTSRCARSRSSGTVPLVAAEDTRHSRRLLAPNEITTHLVSFHARNAAAALPELLAHLRERRRPGPGHRRRDTAGQRPGRRARPGLGGRGRHGRAGPRAPRPSWRRSSRAGSPARAGRSRASCRAGPRAPGAARHASPRTSAATVLYEAPGRVAATLAELAPTCGGDRPGAVCRELTKLHETIVRGTPGRARRAGPLGRDPGPGRVRHRRRGGAGRPRLRQPRSASIPRPLARAEVERLVAAGVARGDAARRVAAATGIPRRKLYGADRVAEGTSGGAASGSGRRRGPRSAGCWSGSIHEAERPDPLSRTRDRPDRWALEPQPRSRAACGYARAEPWFDWLRDHDSWSPEWPRASGSSAARRGWVAYWRRPQSRRYLAGIWRRRVPARGDEDQRSPGREPPARQPADRDTVQIGGVGTGSGQDRPGSARRGASKRG